MAVEPGIYTGTATVHKNTTLLTHTAENFMPKFREAVFSSSSLLKALGVSAFGKAAMIGNDRFGNVTTSSGKGVMFSDGYQFSGPIMTSGPTLVNIDRLATISPQFLDPGNGWAYSWVRGILPLGIPEEVVLDNQGSAKLMDILETNMKLAQSAAVRDITYEFFGSASAPTGCATGLKDLVSVTQTATVGQIAATNSFWQNAYKPCTDVGGGGELNRPLSLLAKLQLLSLTLKSRSSASNDRLWIATQGAYQYVLRGTYADGAPSGNGAVFGIKDFVDAGIEHVANNGSPMIYDSNVTVPTGATASTEAIYNIDLQSTGICFKKNEYFKVEPWTFPTPHHTQRYVRSNILIRRTPYVMNRRDNGVLYNIPANPDAS